MTQFEWTPSQTLALELLKENANVFLTGSAGTGKSTLIRHFLKNKEPGQFPVLASTGAAALLIGGRTFHSFFGLGIMAGGILPTVERAIKDKRVLKRLKKAQGILVDEVSMISGETLFTAEMIAKKARGKNLPWGGLQVIAVGDFCQLPPVTKSSSHKRDWAFLSSAWTDSDFEPVILTEIMRTKDEEFLKILNRVRKGALTPLVAQFLDQKIYKEDQDLFEGTRLFAKRAPVEQLNLKKLALLPQKEHVFKTNFFGKEEQIDQLKKNSPIGDELRIKVDALVMIRQNDPKGKYVNGSMGHIKTITQGVLEIELLDGSDLVTIEPVSFSLLNGDGQEMASARNFPINLAYATTIHKAQGMSLDRVLIDLGELWEPGQAYVALSRARTPQGLWLTRWNPRSILADPTVLDFHRKIWDRTLKPLT